MFKNPDFIQKEIFKIHFIIKPELLEEKLQRL